MGQPIRSFMNSRDRLRTFWRLCIRSSDWWANEKEWSDSEGKRDRSSEKLGDAGPLDKGMVPVCERTAVREGVRERATTEGLREEAFELGMVGFRDGGCCCRIRCRPDKPSPCSCSAIREVVLVSPSRSPGVGGVASKDILRRLRSAGSAEVGRFPVLRFLGSDSGCSSFPRPRSSPCELLSAPWLFSCPP
jgi:hypothetical protein